MKVKKLFSIKNLIIVIAAFVLLTALGSLSFATIKTEQVEGKARTVNVKVTSDKNIKKILLYKKASNDQYILFYKANLKSTKDYVVTIPENKLSTEEETQFKIVVIEEDGTRNVGDITAEKLTPYPSMNPEETAKPSWSPSTLPTKPTPSPSPSSSESAEPSTSSAPTTDPSSSTEPSSSTQPSTETSTQPSTEPSPETSEQPVEGKLEVHYINPNSRVDAIYIKVGDKGIYIDGGFYSDAKAEIAYMDRIGVSKIDYYICSHAHSNHVGAGGAILAKYGIKDVICSKATWNGMHSAKYMMLQKCKTKAEKNAINSAKWHVWEPGSSLNVNGLQINCLGPNSVQKVSPFKTAENYNSLILRMDYGSTSFIFAGDTGGSKLSDANKKYPGKLNVDVYKNSHHNGTLSESVFKLIKPKYVVFTTKDGYLPSSSYLNTIKKYGAKYYIVTNNKDKNVLITSDGTNLKVKTKN